MSLPSEAVAEDVDNVEAGMERSESVVPGLESDLERIGDHLAQAAIADGAGGDQSAGAAAGDLVLQELGRMLAKGADDAYVVDAEETAAGERQVEHWAAGERKYTKGQI